MKFEGFDTYPETCSELVQKIYPESADTLADSMDLGSLLLREYSAKSLTGVRTFFFAEKGESDSLVNYVSGVLFSVGLLAEALEYDFSEMVQDGKRLLAHSSQELEKLGEVPQTGEALFMGILNDISQSAGALAQVLPEGEDVTENEEDPWDLPDDQQREIAHGFDLVLSGIEEFCVAKKITIEELAQKSLDFVTTDNA